MIRNSDVIQEPISQNGGKLGSGLFIARYKTGQPRFDFCHKIGVYFTVRFIAGVSIGLHYYFFF